MRTSIFFKPVAEKAIGAILIILSVVSVIFVAVQTIRLGNVTECQASYNEAYGHAIQARADAARAERHAQRTLLLTVLDPQVPVEQKRAAFDVYLRALDDSDQTRDAARIPTRRC